MVRGVQAQMRKGFKIFIAVLVITLIVMMFGPAVLMLMSGGGHPS